MQTITSADTSLNQVPALFKSKHIARHAGALLLDIGGGKYDTGSDYLWDTHEINALVFDPYNRPQEHNDMVLNEAQYVADVVTCCNVLNVINCQMTRYHTIRFALECVKWDGTVFFQVYEGDRTGNSRQTTKGYQMHQPAAFYKNDITNVMDTLNMPGHIERHGNVIEVRPHEIKVIS